MLQETIKNRTIFCRDNIEILRGIDSNTIDLIYLDPPFNKKKVFTAPIGSSAEGASFKDWFRQEDVKEEWVQTIEEDNEKLYAFLESVKVLDGRKSYNFCYLTYMAIRLIECQRILKDTGSIYLHCDPTMSHYLKILLDILFGESNFRNEIYWERSEQHNLASQRYDIVTDCILFFSKINKFYFLPQLIPINNSSDEDKNILEKKFPYLEKETGRRYNHEKLEKSSNKSSIGYRNIQGKKIHSKLGWVWSQQTFDERLKKNPHVIYWTKNNRPRYKNYLDEYEGKLATNLWTDIKGLSSNDKERTGYPTQKPLALLERIIKASSNKGDVVLDPFCGCATTCVASEKLGRQWIGIDISVKAYDLVKERLAKEVADPENLLQYKNEIHFSTTPPKRTDSGEDLSNKKYVYIISNKRYKNEYKVGIASDVKARLNGYQTSDPNRAYRLEYSIHTDKFREIEKYIHEKFDNRHEWVRDELKDIIKAIEGYEKAK